MSEVLMFCPALLPKALSINAIYLSTKQIEPAKHHVDPATTQPTHRHTSRNVLYYRVDTKECLQVVRNIPPGRGQ